MKSRRRTLTETDPAFDSSRGGSAENGDSQTKSDIMAKLFGPLSKTARYVLDNCRSELLEIFGEEALALAISTYSDDGETPSRQTTDQPDGEAEVTESQRRSRRFANQLRAFSERPRRHISKADSKRFAEGLR